jgi:hypothetical protein
LLNSWETTGIDVKNDGMATTEANGVRRADVVIGSGAGRPARVREYLGANATDGGMVLAGRVYVG